MHYYQGLHDVASVLLLVAGEPAAFDMLCRLSTGHLRDATRSSLDPVIELLGLMGPIVAAADEELASFLVKQGLPPFYALSWFITWFSHDLQDFGEVRLHGTPRPWALSGGGMEGGDSVCTCWAECTRCGSCDAGTKLCTLLICTPVLLFAALLRHLDYAL